MLLGSGCGAEMMLRLNPLSDTIGIEAVGLQLTDAPSQADIETLRNAFSQRSVLVIRDQRLEPCAMLDVVKRFGEVFEQHNKRSRCLSASKFITFEPRTFP